MIPKHEIVLFLLAALGLLSFPVALWTNKGDIFLYGYPLCFPFLIYHIRSKMKKNETRN